MFEWEFLSVGIFNWKFLNFIVISTKNLECFQFFVQNSEKYCLKYLHEDELVENTENDSSSYF